MATVPELRAMGRVRIEVNEAVTIATTGTQVLPRNPNRVNFAIVNQDTTNWGKVRWSRPMTASSQDGIRLDPNGGGYVENYEDIGAAIGEALMGVADTADVSVHVVAWEVY